MSFSVDDLVSSLSGNHIGQEQMDLADLQAQLSQSLFQDGTGSFKAQTGNCNTPMAFSPSTTFTRDLHGGRSRSSSIGNAVHMGRPRQNSISDSYSSGESLCEDYDDEQMVEDLLCPSSPVPVNHPALDHHFAHPPVGTFIPSSQPTSPRMQMCDDFASTDPFYLEQLKLQQAPAPLISPSAFSQFAVAQQQPSPFMMNQPQIQSAQPGYHYFHHPQFEVERQHSHPVFVGAVTFER